MTDDFERVNAVVKFFWGHMSFFGSGELHDEIRLHSEVGGREPVAVAAR